MENNFKYAASVGSSKWYGFETREEAEAWVEQNANGRFAQVVPACLANDVRTPR